MPPMRVRFPPPAPGSICGGSSTVECERAKLAMGVRLSSIAPLLSRISGEDRGLQHREAEFDSRPALRCPRCPTDGRLSSKQHGAGSTPAEGPVTAASCPHHARWIRQPDPHSGNAGSNPAGDAGPSCLPVCHFGGPRPGGRAHQSPCPGGQAPGYELGCRGSTPRREATASVLAEPGPSLRSLCAGFDSRQGREIRHGVSAGTHVGL